MNEMDFIKIKSFCASKYIKKVKSQPTERERNVQVVHLVKDLCLEHLKKSYN